MCVERVQKMPNNHEKEIFYISVFEDLYGGGGHYYFRGNSKTPPIVEIREKHIFTVEDRARGFSEEAKKNAVKRAFRKAKEEADARGIYVGGISTIGEKR